MYINDFEQRFKAAAGQQSTDMVSRTAPHARILVVNDNETNLLVAKILIKRTAETFRRIRINYS